MQTIKTGVGPAGHLNNSRVTWFQPILAINFIVDFANHHLISAIQYHQQSSCSVCWCVVDFSLRHTFPLSRQPQKAFLSSCKIPSKWLNIGVFVKLEQNSTQQMGFCRAICATACCCHFQLFFTFSLGIFNESFCVALHETE